MYFPGFHGMMPVEFGFKEYDEMQCINRTRQQRAEFASSYWADVESGALVWSM